MDYKEKIKHIFNLFQRSIKDHGKQEESELDLNVKERGLENAKENLNILQLLRKFHVEELIIDMVKKNVDSIIKSPIPIKHYLTYQEAYQKKYIKQLKSIFIEKLEFILDVLKKDIIDHFVNHLEV